MKATDLIPYNILAAAAIALWPCTAQAAAGIGEEIDKLDRALDMAEEYVATHNVKVMTIENMLHSRGVSLEQQYEIYGQLYDEYVAFQFDMAMEMLDRQTELAKELNDRRKIADVTLNRAMLYTTSGMFFEANILLSSSIDTTVLTRPQLIEYYNIQQRFYVDFNEYTQTPEMNRISAAKVRYYRDRILKETTSASEAHQYIVIRDCMDSGDFVRADQLNRQLLAKFNPNSHQFAVHAYDQARICEALEQTEEKILWYTRSATADVKCATKDNASLCCLAQAMLQENQIDRAFRYITISLNDALFYNAKLRPWQIASVIPMIEKSYQESIARQQKHTHTYFIIALVLATALLGICLLVVYLYHRSQVTRRKIESMHRQIKEYNVSLSESNEKAKIMNAALIEANTVKEEYIGLFLSMCSNYIEKLMSYQRNVRRKLAAGKIAELKAESSSSEVIDAELE
ncbi:MAG: hypothetical protein K2O07_01495, partial [Alistipes sp.]|nr:hypothetical protein [Alistipes sp.]